MNKGTAVVVGVAVFGGMLAAFQVDRWLQSRSEVGAPRIVLGTGAPASLETASGLQAQAPVDFRAASRAVLPSVVSVDRLQRIRSFWDSEARVAETGSGSGVILSRDGVIVTNNHVVQGATQVKVRLSDNRTFDAKVLGRDPRSDIAVLKIEASDLTPIKLGDSSSVEVGEWVLAVGNPLGWDQTVSVGVVSSLNRNLNIGGTFLVNAIQTDAAINPGNSGGALTNIRGELIGINSAIASPSGASVGIGFSIPVNRVKRLVDDIVAVGYPRYAGLGVQSRPDSPMILGDPQIRAQLARELGTEAPLPREGLLIVGVGPGSPAAQAGMKRGDILLSIAGQKMDSALALNEALMDRRPGDRVEVEFWSMGERRRATIALQELRPEL